MKRLCLILACFVVLGSMAQASPARAPLTAGEQFAQAVNGRHAIPGPQGCADVNVYVAARTESQGDLYRVELGNGISEWFYTPYMSHAKVARGTYSYSEVRCQGAFGRGCERTKLLARRDATGHLVELKIEKGDPYWFSSTLIHCGSARRGD